ncbi:MAG: CDP-archaeol synthase [Ruminococcaceae bacterium]|nr:CDP-archaeol synthase [Oscillospiraceae bacterium]
MKTRIITAAVLLCILAPILIFSHTFVYVVFAAVLALVATYELLGCMRLVSRIKLTLTSMVYSVLTVSLTRASSASNGFMKIFVCATFVYIFVLLTFSLFESEKQRESLPEIMFAASVVIYITVGFSSFVVVRDLVNGTVLFPLAYIAAWVSDTGAYFAGVKFGNIKLIPEISPKKTVEGFIGGLCSCVAVFMIYAGCVHIFSKDLSPNYIWIFVCAVLLSVASVIGDLIASMIKRRYHIKDYSHLFPGHGGVLDRFDSIIATTAGLFVLSSIMPLFYTTAG